MLLAPNGLASYSIVEKTIMAEVLLSEKSRKLLASILDGKRCPQDFDQLTFQAIQRGDRFAVSIRNLAALVSAHGDIVLQAIPGLRR